MEQRRVEITTFEGSMTTFVHHPTHGGPHPVVLYLMDAPSIRPELHQMASRLASAGYYVLLPFLFYRGSEFKEFGADDADMHQRFELMGTVTPTNIVSDAEALLAHAADDPAAADGPVGVVGFCMSGGLAISLARAMPERVTAAASIHGAWLVRDTDDSPHLDLDPVQAEIHLAWCAEDTTAPPEHRDQMEAALRAAGVTYTLDWHDDAVHGFAPPGPRHHREASELHWERVHSLLRRRVG
jgi:carboxymethylenebutenolidase